MKHLKKLYIVGLVLLMGMLFGCQSRLNGIKGSNGKGLLAKNNKTDVVGFRYSYDGTIGGDNHQYNVRYKDGKCILTYSLLGKDDMSMEVDPSILSQLKDLYLKHNVARWDGYDKYSTYVLDGSGFSFNYYFEDGQVVSVSGYNCSPKGYYEFEKEMYSLFSDYVEELIQNDIQAHIENGITGNLDLLMVNFIQKGNSGSDTYNFFISKESIGRENNFDVTIKSVSGDFIEPGEYKYYCHLSDEYFDYNKIQELLEKYEIIKWYDYEKSAEDYNNSEWFQVDFNFDDDSHISAMGTEHPENYDEFRRELISFVVNTIKVNEEKGTLTKYQ